MEERLEGEWEFHGCCSWVEWSERTGIAANFKRSRARPGPTLFTARPPLSDLCSQGCCRQSMTSHFISYFARRQEAQARITPPTQSAPVTLASSATSTSTARPIEGIVYSGIEEEGCTFCRIASGKESAFQASLTSDLEVPKTNHPLNGDIDDVTQVYEDEHCLAFLGELFRRQHLLLSGVE